MKEILSQSKIPVALALGFFDSLHIVHRRIISNAVDYAKQNGCSSAVFTFMDDGICSLKGDMIYLYNERKKLLEQLCVDYVVPFVFSECATLDKLEFLDKITTLVEVKAIFCGYDFTFGYKGQGEVAFLQNYCDKKGIQLFVAEKEIAYNEKISSSMIKKFLLSGEIEKANSLLVNPYSITSTVIKGRGEGSLFGFPTANILTNKNKMLIKEGVYGTFTIIDGKKYESVTSVGIKPTFNDMSVSIETLIKDFNGNIYDKEITIEFNKYIRDIYKFESKELLKAQIDKDLEWERNL